MLRQLSGNISVPVELHVVRTFAIEGGDCSAKSRAASKLLEAEFEVRRRRRRGDFRWVIADDCSMTLTGGSLVCNVNELYLKADQFNCRDRDQQRSLQSKADTERKQW